MGLSFHGEDSILSIESQLRCEGRNPNGTETESTDISVEQRRKLDNGIWTQSNDEIEMNLGQKAITY